MCRLALFVGKNNLLDVLERFRAILRCCVGSDRYLRVARVRLRLGVAARKRPAFIFRCVFRRLSEWCFGLSLLPLFRIQVPLDPAVGCGPTEVLGLSLPKELSPTTATSLPGPMEFDLQQDRPFFRVQSPQLRADCTSLSASIPMVS